MRAIICGEGTTVSHVRFKNVPSPPNLPSLSATGRVLCCSVSLRHCNAPGRSDTSTQPLFNVYLDTSWEASKTVI